ncbi:hypothetical protein BT67DRAFT_435581 [Trichocladium antarcticum]|uniref:Uncharacterized protein n=1 Tax=Trichocladium antarcticum TaxID=1450529 RepID=A0AAN6UH31_9PEZI|nr:hypothetical protein BT67DRAFT_435581 [Trichocladium antarcticum]
MSRRPPLSLALSWGLSWACRGAFTHWHTTNPDWDAGPSQLWPILWAMDQLGEVFVVETMLTDITTSAGRATTTDTSGDTGTSSTDESGIGSNRRLVITLSTVLTAVAVVLIAGVVLLCWRRRRRRLPFLSRGISPVDDDEIAAWKTPRDEKACFPGSGDTDVEADGGSLHKEAGRSSHAQHPSLSSLKKPPSVIVYSNAHGQGRRRQSADAEPRHSSGQRYSHPAHTKISFEKALPQTPIQARAPNARAGLTDESVPGDEPFLPSPRRNPSRLSKHHHPPHHPPNSSSQRRHARARSSRSSTRSFGDLPSSPYYYPGHDHGSGSGGSDMELSGARHSHSPRSQGRSRHSHSRVYSSSSVPPRSSFGDEARLTAGSSPGRAVFVGGEIGRAIG